MKNKLLFFGVLLLLANSGILKAQSIVAGYYNSYAKCSDGSIRVWGGNEYGQIGNGTKVGIFTPSKIDNLIGMTAGFSCVSSGVNSYYIKNDGTIWASGDNYYGQLGNNDYIESKVPVQVLNLTDVKSIVGGPSFALALKNDGTVWGWGANGYGTLGDGTKTDRWIPVQTLNLTNVIAISAGSHFALALKSDGTVWSWGSNIDGTLGNGSTNTAVISTPKQIAGLSNVIEIKTGNSFTLALKSDGTIWGWGSGGWYVFGNNSTAKKYSPFKLDALSDIKAIGAGEYHGIALHNDGTVSAWGNNSQSCQLGDGTKQDRRTPIKVTGLSGIKSIAVGGFHNFAINSQNKLFAWGGNFDGQIGDGQDVNDVCTPVEITTICDFPTSVSELNDIQSIKIFPNPFNEQATVYLSSYLLNASLIISDISGREINRKYFSGNEVIVYKGNLNAGIYFVSIFANNQKIATKKIVIE